MHIFSNSVMIIMIPLTLFQLLSIHPHVPRVEMEDK